MTCRRSVAASWRLLTQRFMGPLLVVAGSKVLKGPLLPLPGGLGRAGGLRLQRPVQPLQPPVLFRMPWLNALREDLQLDPPHGQGRQAAQAHAGKGRPVVRADSPWKTVLPEGPLQYRAYLRASGLAQSVAHHQVTRRGILHGQGIDANAVAGAKPALEVDAPQVVGWSAWTNGWLQGAVRRRRLRRPTSPASPSKSPTVLGAGQSRLASGQGSRSCSQATSFLGPHVGCSHRSAIRRSTTARFVWLGCLWAHGSGRPDHPNPQPQSDGAVCSRFSG